MHAELERLIAVEPRVARQEFDGERLEHDLTIAGVGISFRPESQQQLVCHSPCGAWIAR